MDFFDAIKYKGPDVIEITEKNHIADGMVVPCAVPLRTFIYNGVMYKGSFCSTYKQANICEDIVKKVSESGVLGDDILIEPKMFSTDIHCKEHKGSREPSCDSCVKVDLIYGNINLVIDVILNGAEMDEMYRGMMFYFGKFKDLETVAVNIIRRELYSRGFIVRKYGEREWKSTGEIIPYYLITTRH